MDHETSPHPKLRFDGSKHQKKSLLGSRLPDDEEDQVPHVVLALWTDISSLHGRVYGFGCREDHLLKDDGVFRASGRIVSHTH